MPSQFGGYRLGGMTFDDDRLIRLIEKEEREWLMFCGALIRRESRGKIRKKKKASRPGTPPRSKTGKLKRGIFFAVEAGRVVVGPAPFVGSQSEGEAPRVLEHGGRIVIGKKDKKTVQIEARPYMQPSLDRLLPKLRDLWENRIKRSR